MKYKIVMSTGVPGDILKWISYPGVIRNLKGIDAIIVLWSYYYDRIHIEYNFLSKDIDYTNMDLHYRIFCNKFFSDKDLSKTKTTIYVNPVVRHNNEYVVNADISVAFDDIWILPDEVATSVLMNLDRFL